MGRGYVHFSFVVGGWDFFIFSYYVGGGFNMDPLARGSVGSREGPEFSITFISTGGYYFFIMRGGVTCIFVCLWVGQFYIIFLLAGRGYFYFILIFY